MNRLPRAAAIFVAVISIFALITAALGGGILLAMKGLVGVMTLGQAKGALANYPLGAGVFVVYACGIALSLAALRWPVATGIAMLPLGAVAFLFGGPIAKVYGIVIFCAGLLLLATGRRGNAH
jgi:hypothetical protein